MDYAKNVLRSGRKILYGSLWKNSFNMPMKKTL
jgi:hypothetical protein